MTSVPVRYLAPLLLALTAALAAQTADPLSVSRSVIAPEGSSAILRHSHDVTLIREREVIVTAAFMTRSGRSRLDIRTSETGVAAASTGELAAEDLAESEMWEIETTVAIPRDAERLLVDVVAIGGQTSVSTLTVRLAPDPIAVEEDFGDAEALRRAAEALLAELGEDPAPKIEAKDHDGAGCGHDHSGDAPAEPQSRPAPEKKDGGDTEEESSDVILCSLRTAPVNVVTTLPILADLARIVGGEDVSVSTLCRPGLDPHDVRMTPALTAQLKKAELFIENGMGLEGWTTRALETSGRTFLTPGHDGHVYATNGITAIEKPTPEEIARGGHVHAAGNPHVWLDPLNLKIMVRNVEAGLSRLRRDRSDVFRKNREAFEKNLDERLFGKELCRLLGSRLLTRLQRSGRLIGFLENKKVKGEPLITKLGGWLGRARALGDTTLITYHKTWSYFSRSLGLAVVGTIEEKPGIPPSPAHIDGLVKTAREKRTRIVASAPYYPTNRIESVAERIGGSALMLPTQPGEAEGAKDALTMFDTLLKLIEDGTKRAG